MREQERPMPQLIPQPERIELREGVFTDGCGASEAAGRQLAGEGCILEAAGRQLAGEGSISEVAGRQLAGEGCISEAAGRQLAGEGSISEATGRQLFEGRCISEIINRKLPEEGYLLRISPEGVTIEASGMAGFFYGRQTYGQLRMQYGSRIPCMVIEDFPRYSYRGFHLDCARHFIPVEELKKNIACAAAFKLNHFHWHFSDDQGYRIESDVFPLLTEVGAKRMGDHFGSYSDDAPEQHFYTKDEVREVVAFAGEHFVEVVPEVDMPGHVTAILAAYPELSCSGEKLNVATKEGIFSDILCAGKEQTYEFIEKLIEELAGLFPGKYFHIGGDEVPKTRWNQCPLCRKKMAEEGLRNGQELQGYLQNRVAAMLKRRGKRAIAWNEAALGGNLDPEILLQLWNDGSEAPAVADSRPADGFSDAESGSPVGPDRGIGARHIRRGGSVISSDILHSYCDYPHAFVKTKTIYEADITPQECGDIPDAAAHVEGGEALCWTEHIRSAERLEYMIWPRFAAKADNLWSKSGSRDYQKFLAAERALRPVYERCGIRPAPEEEFEPGPEAGARQMAEFRENLGTGTASCEQ